MKLWITLLASLLLLSVGCESDPASMIDAGSATDASSDRICDGLTLPGGDFYPEGIAAGPAGAIAVASAGTGQIVVFPAGQTDSPTELVPAAAPEIANAIGIRYDETANLYWVCSTDFNGLFDNANGTLVGVSPADGGIAVTHPLATGALCNDIAVSATHGVYATDSRGSQIWRIPRANVMTADSAEVWVTDARFGDGLAADALSLNGIAIDEAAGAVYSARIDSGALFRIALMDDGTAGAVEEVALTGGDIAAADGITLEATNTLLVIQNDSGEVDRVKIDGKSGTVESVATGLEEPATGVIVGTELLVTYTQFSHLFGGTLMPALPFCVGRVELGS